jgi:hypothetical protein
MPSKTATAKVLLSKRTACSIVKLISGLPDLLCVLWLSVSDIHRLFESGGVSTSTLVINNACSHALRIGLLVCRRFNQDGNRFYRQSTIESPFTDMASSSVLSSSVDIDNQFFLKDVFRDDVNIILSNASENLKPKSQPPIAPESNPAKQFSNSNMVITPSPELQREHVPAKKSSNSNMVVTPSPKRHRENFPEQANGVLMDITASSKSNLNVGVEKSRCSMRKVEAKDSSIVELSLSQHFGAGPIRSLQPLECIKVINPLTNLPIDLVFEVQADLSYKIRTRNCEKLFKPHKKNSFVCGQCQVSGSVIKRLRQHVTRVNGRDSKAGMQLDSKKLSIMPVEQIASAIKAQRVHANRQIEFVKRRFNRLSWKVDSILVSGKKTTSEPRNA